MRLSRPFHRLPVRFDVARLREEVAALPTDAWVDHPNGVAGNSALRLISVDGGENDDVLGPMRPTAHLLRSPYLRQVLAGFGVVWSRSRLMKLAAGADVADHADINYHWHYRVRVHVPITTQPEVSFRCGDERVHMAAGDAWIFDNWRRHSVHNGSDAERVHLVADTTGDAAFWQLVAHQAAGGEPQLRRFDPQQDAMPLMERATLRPVLNPAELELLVGDLRAELVSRDGLTDASARLARYHTLLEDFCRDWRQLHARFGDEGEGRPSFERLRDGLRQASAAAGDGLEMRTNAILAHRVLEGRVLRVLLAPATPSVSSPRGRPSVLRRPVFIVAAPRSGSSLLFETLATSGHVATLGGEAHWLVEDIGGLRPDRPGGVESNRLTAEHATPDVQAAVDRTLLQRLVDAQGRPVAPDADLRILEKTPKNALRIPFFARLFPDAQFVFLWRDPRENLSSIIEAWRAGRWRTYNGLPGFAGPWSLLLPPGWRAFDGRPLEEIAAFQWESANRIALDDLAALPRERWMTVRYDTFVADPRGQTAAICAFAGIEPDLRLRSRVAVPLPLSRHTLTPPDGAKWRRNAEAIARVLPQVDATWQRLQAL